MNSSSLNIQEALQDAINNTNTSILNMSDVGALLRVAISKEKNIAHNEIKADNKIVSENKRIKKKRATKKAKNQQLLRNRSKNSKILTRSKTERLQDKNRLTTYERHILNTKFNVNRCTACEKNKGLDCFYRKLNTLPGQSQYNTSCIACHNFIYNSQPTRIGYKEIYNSIKRGAMTRNLEFTITIEDLERLYEKQNGRCNYTGEKLIIQIKREREKIYGRNQFCTRAYHNLNRASVDRIDPNKGYTIDNIHLVSIHINYAKLDLLDEDFVSMCTKVSDQAKVRAGPVLPPLMDNSSSSIESFQSDHVHLYKLVSSSTEPHSNIEDNVVSHQEASYCSTSMHPDDLQENECLLKE